MDNLENFLELLNGRFSHYQIDEESVRYCVNNSRKSSRIFNPVFHTAVLIGFNPSSSLYVEGCIDNQATKNRLIDYPLIGGGIKFDSVVMGKDVKLPRKVLSRLSKSDSDFSYVLGSESVTEYEDDKMLTTRLYLGVPQVDSNKFKGWENRHMQCTGLGDLPRRYALIEN